MKQEIAEQLAAALTSGEYKQGKGHLAQIKDGGEVRHCCLGVLCELAIKAGVKIKRRIEDDGRRMTFSYEGKFPPKAVLRWAGMKWNTGAYSGGRLMDDNDGGKRFPTIAKIITAHAAEL